MTTETINRDTLVPAIRDAIAGDMEVDDLVRTAISMGYVIEVESDDPEDADFSEGELPRDVRIATTQTHRLLVDGDEVAELTREGWSYYGDPDNPNTPSGEWTTESGENDRGVPAAWMTVCDVARLSGDWEQYPCAAEPETEEPETDDDGEYCLWWSTVGDDDGPLTRTRYPTLRDARIACDAADLDLRLRHRGTLLCGYGIAQLVDGEWEQITDDE